MAVGDSKTLRAIFDAEGDENVIKALRDIANGMQRVGTQQKRTAKSGQDLARSFRNILIRTIAIVGVIRTFRLINDSIRDVIKTGLEFNQTIETAELAIASLITATADLATANGDIVTGVEALDRAYGLAEDQVQKLRIAGIQTAATTQELVDAFQQAVGAGVKTGLTLDEIRVVTIRIAQAAGALGVPYRQLNEEIRSILGGIIDQNTRIAKSLGLTNEQIRLAKEQGRLADFLLESFEAFGIAGDRIVLTFAALKSNVQETVEILSGDITRPLFEALRTRGFVNLERIFDFDTAQIADEFKGLVDGLQSLFFFVGDLAGDSIETLIDGLADVSDFFDENRGDVAKISQEFRDMAESAGRMARQFVQATAEGGFFSQQMETAADIMEFMADNPIAKVVAGITAATAAAALLASILSGPVAVTIATLGLLFLGAGKIDQLIVTPTERITDREREIALLIDEQDEANTAAIANARLNQQYKFQIDRLNSLERGTADHTEALARLLAIEEQIVDAGFGAELERANGNRVRATSLIRDQVQEEQKRIVGLLRAAELEKELLDATIARAEASPPAVDPDNLFQNLRRGARGEPIPESSATRAARQLVGTLEVQIAALQEDADRLEALLSGQGVELLSNAEDDAKGELEALRAEVRAAMAKITADLRIAEAQLNSQLTQNVIGITEFARRITQEREKAFGLRVEQQQRLIEAEEAAGEVTRAAAARAKLSDIEADREVQRLKEQTELRSAQVTLAQQVERANIQLLEATGQAAEAAGLRIRASFKETIQDLKAEGDRASLDIFEQLFASVEEQAAFNELETRIGRLQSALRADRQRVTSQADIGLIGSEEARRQQAAAMSEFRDELAKVLPELQKFADLSQNPALQEQARELIALYDELGIEIRGLTDDWLRFKAEFRAAAEDTLADFLSDAVLEAESLGEALRNLSDIKSLLAELAAAVVQLTARLIALKLVQAAFGLSEGGEVAAVAGATGLAEGGPVRGPGGPTADRVFARLSAGEYVVRASSVKKYGTGFFDQVNKGMMPRHLRRFQAGGLVSNTKGDSLGTQSDAGAFRGELGIGLSDGLVVSSMDTTDGRRLILKVINQNRRGVRQALGI